MRLVLFAACPVLGMMSACSLPNRTDSSHMPKQTERSRFRGGGGETGMISLGESLDALRDRFNEAKGRFRFVALLSPT